MCQPYIESCTALSDEKIARNNVVIVHTVQLKPMIKAQISGRMVSSGISDVAIASVYLEKTV